MRARIVEGEVDTRLMWTRGRPAQPRDPGLLVRGALPTNLDVLPALYFAYLFFPYRTPR
ncbi:hypothetical protein [Actinoplanes sp. G11-F43]|uniref:hypothetical protein n=1 Tax=Actinoplanes sp. G11-F43 TaxID=3424130 RepID=UPI003D32F0E4